MHKILLLLSVIAGSFAIGAEEPSDMGSTVTGTMPSEPEEVVATQKWNAGITSGISASSKDEIDNSPSFGIDIGYQPNENFNAGMEAITARQDDANKYQRTTALLKGTYVLGGDIPVVKSTYIGGGAGPVFISNKVRWAGAPIVGFDVPLSSKSVDYLSLGLNAKYVFTTNNDDVPRELLSALAIKYWF
ncbi:MAG: hypothetical protein EHM20_10120 [Alphaproteobacteria bacterium]|nr:MAG: hypothetical protein EHM20_10120 [Alphaproteobacteria bacterium]